MSESDGARKCLAVLLGRSLPDGTMPGKGTQTVDGERDGGEMEEEEIRDREGR